MTPLPRQVPLAPGLHEGCTRAARGLGKDYPTRLVRLSGRPAASYRPLYTPGGLLRLVCGLCEGAGPLQPGCQQVPQSGSSSCLLTSSGPQERATAGHAHPNPTSDPDRRPAAGPPPPPLPPATPAARARPCSSSQPCPKSRALTPSEPWPAPTLQPSRGLRPLVSRLQRGAVSRRASSAARAGARAGAPVGWHALATPPHPALGPARCQPHRHRCQQCLTAPATPHAQAQSRLSSPGPPSLWTAPSQCTPSSSSMARATPARRRRARCTSSCWATCAPCSPPGKCCHIIELAGCEVQLV